MDKAHLNLSVNKELISEAKEKGLNISEILEEALGVKLDKTEVSFNEPTHCNFCGVEGKRATETKDGLTWIYPNEKWICPKCLILKGQHLI